MVKTRAMKRKASLSRRRSYRRRVRSSPCRRKGPAVCRSMKNCKYVSKKRRYCRKSKNTKRRRGGARRSHGGARRTHHGGARRSYGGARRSHGGKKRLHHAGKKSRRSRRRSRRRGGFVSAEALTPFALTAALFAKKKKGMRK